MIRNNNLGLPTASTTDMTNKRLQSAERSYNDCPTSTQVADQPLPTQQSVPSNQLQNMLLSIVTGESMILKILSCSQQRVPMRDQEQKIRKRNRVSGPGASRKDKQGSFRPLADTTATTALQ